MARSSGKIARLPNAIRDQINQRILDGDAFPTITAWLFDQKAERDIPDLNLRTGDPYSLAWTPTAKNESAARTWCANGLSNWFRGGYQAWLAQRAAQDSSIRLLEHSEELNRVASEKAQPTSLAGGNLIIRTLLSDTIRSIFKEERDPADIARLANAWARLNQTSTETERLKLQTQESIDTGLQALLDDIKDNPKAVQQFKKLRDIVNAPAKQTS